MSNVHQSQSRSRSRSGGLHSESGVAITEFALVLPLLAVLLFGMIEFGRAINYWIDATHLANEAARWAVVNQNPGSSSGQTLQQYIQSQATTGELKNGGTSSVPNPLAVAICFPSGALVGQPVRATASVTYNWLPFIGSRTGIGSSTIRGSAHMRLEAIPTNYSASGPC
jgi:Flp pilus assembly protein TadG